MILRQTVILPLLLLLSVPVGGNAADTPDPAVAAARLFAERFPELSAKTVQPSPIAGLFEVQLDNRIIYFAPESGLLLVGDLWAPHGENLTRKRMTEIMAAQAEIMAAKVAAIPLDKALKIGDGKHVVIEVTDPDCPYCRKGDEFLALRDDLTRYIFFMPLAMHPDAPKKAAYILSAKNPELALAEVSAGKYDQQPLPEFKDNGRLVEQETVVRKLGITSTPNYWINGTFVSGANLEAMGKLLK
ncbi:MAG: hypothetical protein A2091_10145 [Desulfuromonadales bacterium GWD2_61_12]|nr:MAG: hypothetical protein A2005_03650 [Desulfuromonadales bacterium GWC2_61_20]OGR34671.1 MAG: hypothetical protein A2091_10145 [Desulfuromonadales bacterium GWD2_61_12]HAD05029.1 protein-disulfide isomerase [Desulfuromonas sp.]